MICSMPYSRTGPCLFLSAFFSFNVPSRHGNLMLHILTCQLHICLVAKVRSDGSLEPGGHLARHLCQVLEIITGRDAKLAHKVLGRRLEIAILLLRLILRSSKVSIGRDGTRALEALESGLGLSLGVGVKGTLAEEFV